MDKDKIRESARRAWEKTKKKSCHKDIDKKLEELGEDGGTHLGPRNDIERQKLLREIEESGKEDEKENH